MATAEPRSVTAAVPGLSAMERVRRPPVRLQSDPGGGFSHEFFAWRHCRTSRRGGRPPAAWRPFINRLY